MVAETSYAGTFTPSTAGAGAPASCSGIATIAVSGNATLLITPVGAGACTYTIAGGGTSAQLAVNVTVTNVGGS